MATDNSLATKIAGLKKLRYFESVDTLIERCAFLDIYTILEVPIL